MDPRKDMVGVLFQMASRSWRQAMQAELNARGLEDLGNPLILLTLKAQGRNGKVAAQRELADELHISPAAVAMSLKSLERCGYVEKQPDAADQRRKGVALTEKGETAVCRCLEAFRDTDARMFEGFDAEERRELTRYFRRMMENLGGLPECPSPPPRKMTGEKEVP